MMQPTRRPSVVVAQHAAPFLSLVASTILLLGCAGRRITKDYVFNVTGIVETQDDVHLQGADVTLEMNGPVYEVIDLVTTRHVVTDENGGFVFAYISHERGVKYTITVGKEGFEQQTVSGAAPPNGNHVIKLKKPIEPLKSDAGARSLLSRTSQPTAHCSSHV
jgi:hypothetical protein